MVEPVQQQEKSGRRVNWSFLLIMAVFILPFIVLPLVMPPEKMKKSNKGVFIQPHVSAEELHLKSEQGFIVNAQSMSDKWKLLYFVPAKCDAACKNALFTIRQVPQSLDRDAGRVESLLVIVSNQPDPMLSELLDNQFLSLPRFYAAAEDVDNAFSESLENINASTAGYIYLMSPDGYIFMKYDSYADEQESILKARDIRKDLKTTLKGELNKTGV